MGTQTRSRYVDVSDPALAITCPRCGLITARFMEFCTNCGYQLWPSDEMASAAFDAWKAADPARRAASRFMLALPDTEDSEQPSVVDYFALAHELGIDVFLPYTPYPFLIAVGVLLLGLSAGRLWDGEPGWTRIALAVSGALVLLYGVYGWAVREDVRMYPSGDG